MPRLGLLAFIWGGSFLFIKVAGEGMTPSTVAATRVALGLVVLATVVRLRGLLLGFVGVGVAADPTVASVVTYLVPVVAVVAGAVFLGEPFEVRLMLGGSLTVAGIVLLNGRPLRRPPAPTSAPAAGH